MAHLPGPWRVSDPRDWHTRIIAADGGVVCRMAGQTTDADTDLLTAAPDLLAAARLYVEHFGDPLKKLRPAIAKAEGQGRT